MILVAQPQPEQDLNGLIDPEYIPLSDCEKSDDTSIYEAVGKFQRGLLCMK